MTILVQLKADGILSQPRTVSVPAVPRVGDTFWLMDEDETLEVASVQWAAERDDAMFAPVVTLTRIDDQPEVDDSIGRMHRETVEPYGISTTLCRKSGVTCYPICPDCVRKPAPTERN